MLKTLNSNILRQKSHPLKKKKMDLKKEKPYKVSFTYFRECPALISSSRGWTCSQRGRCNRGICAR